MLSKHPSFCGCEIDQVCFKGSYPAVVETIVSHNLNSGSCITESLELFQAEQRYVTAIDGINEREREILCNARVGLPSNKPLVSPILQFL